MKQYNKPSKSCTIYSIARINKKLVPWGTDGRLPLSDLDLDLGSGHTAYRRASLIDLKFQISLRSEERIF